MKAFWTTFIIFGCIASTGFSQETVAETDTPPPPAATTEAPTPPAAEDPAVVAARLAADQPPIPVPYEKARYEAVWGKNPFLLKTKGVTAPTVSWAQDWALAGMFKNDGKISVSLVNKQTGEYKDLSNQGQQDSEYRLVQASFNRDRSEAFAEVAKGEDTQTLKYDDNLTSKPVTINNTQHAAPGANTGAAGNNPAVRGGVPGKPGTVPVNRNGVPGVVNPGGLPQGGVGGVNPNVNPGAGPVPINANPAATAPPSISRRRQLVPAPVTPPQQ